MALPTQAIFCFFLSSLLCLVSLRLSTAVGGMDVPDGVRKCHLRPTPRLGGMAFFSSFALVSLLGMTAPSDVLPLLFGGALLVLSGFLDDTRSLSPQSKLPLQFLAAAGALFLFDPPTRISCFSLSLSLPAPLSFFLFSLYLVASVNAVNFIDGADGLAAGCVLPMLFGLSLLFLQGGEEERLRLALLLAFALLGFLPFNRPPARLFMGDAGSQFLGFALAYLTLRRDAFSLSRLLFLALPLSDLCVTVSGRILKKKSPFAADRTHFHHRLAARGFSPREILFFAFSLSLAASTLGVALSLL